MDHIKSATAYFLTVENSGQYSEFVELFNPQYGHEYIRIICPTERLSYTEIHYKLLAYPQKCETIGVVVLSDNVKEVLESLQSLHIQDRFKCTLWPYSMNDARFKIKWEVDFVFKKDLLIKFMLPAKSRIMFSLYTREKV